MPCSAGSDQRIRSECMHLGRARLHISGQALDAQFLGGLSAFALASYFGFSAQEDAQLQPGIYISRPARLCRPRVSASWSFGMLRLPRVLVPSCELLHIVTSCHIGHSPAPA